MSGTYFWYLLKPSQTRCCNLSTCRPRPENQRRGNLDVCTAAKRSVKVSTRRQSRPHLEVVDAVRVGSALVAQVDVVGRLPRVLVPRPGGVLRAVDDVGRDDAVRVRRRQPVERHLDLVVDDVEWVPRVGDERARMLRWTRLCKRTRYCVFVLCHLVTRAQFGIPVTILTSTHCGSVKCVFL